MTALYMWNVNLVSNISIYLLISILLKLFLNFIRKNWIAKKICLLSLILELRFRSDEDNDVKYFHRQASTLIRF